mgnify:CR=1 FL=1
MKKEFIPYKYALELKELGFDEICLGYYFNGNTFSISMNNTMFTKNSIVNNRPDNVITAPLWQQAFDWFREKYNLHYIIYKNINIDGYDFCRVTTDGITNKNTYSYEEARLECLKKLIEICKNN